MKNPEWKNYKNAEFLQFYERFIAITEGHDLKTMGLTSQAKDLRPKFQEMFEVYDRSAKSELSKELVELDDLRDGACKLIRKTLEAYETHYVEEQRLASELILPLFLSYDKQVETLPYAEETLAINQIYKRITTSTERVTALETLVMTAWVEQLKTLNDSFEALYIERTRNAASTNTLPLREELIELYDMFMQHVTARNTIMPSVSYDKLNEEIIELIEKTNLSSKLRKIRGGDDEQDDVITSEVA